MRVENSVEKPLNSEGGFLVFVRSEIYDAEVVEVMGKKLTLEEIRDLYENENREILDIETREYGNKGKTQTYVKYKCLIDGYKGWQGLNKMQQGQGCAVCGGNIIHDGNKLSTVKPDLLKYLVNIEDGNKYSIGSHKKIYLKCPECGKHKEKPTIVKHFVNHIFICSYCDDGISIPEKFGRHLFEQININFETQYTPKWANKKRYDFYIENKIIEVHGESHYKYTGRGRTLKEEQENDLYKKNKAYDNGFTDDNYIVIDCRYSTFEWLKENYEKQLNKHFNLSNVDWNKVWLDCQHSLIIQVCNAWNDRKENDTTLTIANHFKLSRSVIIKWLNIGFKLNICNYDSSIEKIKRGKEQGLLNSKRVNQYDIYGNFIQYWVSTCEASRQLKITRTSISECANGNLKTVCNKFVFRYEGDEFDKYPIAKNKSYKKLYNVTQMEILFVNGIHQQKQ